MNSKLCTRPFLLASLALAAACVPQRPRAGIPPVVRRRELRRSIDALLARPGFANMHWGIVIVDPVAGDTLYSHNAGKLFIPASNQKLLTGATALSVLGPSFRYFTSVESSGPISGGVLAGSLLIRGSGDPSFSDAMAGNAVQAVGAIADSIVARGVTRITGSVESVGDAFPDSPLGFGWSWDDLDFPFSAGVDELMLNEGFFGVTIRGGASPGEPIEVVRRIAGDFPRVVSQAVTESKGAKSTLRLEHDSSDATLAWLRGSIGAGDSATVLLAFRDQRRAFLENVRSALLLRGVRIEGQDTVRASRGPVGREPPSYALFSIASRPLSEILPFFEKPSQNQIGEILLKTIGRARTGVGSADSGARVMRDQLVAWGARPEGAVIRDGSGLSRYNVVTPETIVRVLDAMRLSPHYKVFHDALPVAGVDGTLRSRMRGTQAQGKVRAKTGTLNMVRSLSGYATGADGRMLLFSVLANNWTVPLREIDAVQDSIGVLVSRYRR